MDIVGYAEEYVSRGWSILPVRPVEKRPYMRNWLQYEHERADLDTVVGWFSNLTGAGVGLVTGKISGVVVLDLDPRHGCPPLDEMLSKYPTGMVAESGGGGWHLYYQYPKDRGRVSNRVGIMRGVDLRADGGFIVLPPTMHECGNRYKWVRDGMPSIFPSELLELHSQPLNTNRDEWITETLRGVSEGGRNDACARLAGYFFKKGMGRDIIEALLVDWNERNDPPLPLHEIRTTIKSVGRTASESLLNAGQWTSVEFEDDSDSRGGGFELVKLDDYVRGYGDGGSRWMVDNWMVDKSITFIVSPPESYKTWLMLDLAVSISSGMPFLGQFEVRDPGPVFIIQQEDSHGGITERLSLIVMERLGEVPHTDGDEISVPDIPDLPIYIHPSRRLNFANEKVLAELEEQIEEIRPRAILIDPLYSTTTTDNYMAGSAEQMMCLKTWRDRYGCSVVIAHHSKKNVDPDSTAREDSWGSQFLNAFLEAGWQIRRSSRLDNNQIVVRRHSKTMGNQSPVLLTWDISTRYPFSYSCVVEDYQGRGPSGGPAALNSESRPTQAQQEILDLFDSRGSLTQAQAAQAIGKSPSTINRHFKKMEDKGLVIHNPDGSYARATINVDPIQVVDYEE